MQKQTNTAEELKDSIKDYNPTAKNGTGDEEEAFAQAEEMDRSDNTQDAVEEDGKPVLDEIDLEENDISEEEAEDIEWEEPKK